MQRACARCRFSMLRMAGANGDLSASVEESEGWSIDFRRRVHLDFEVFDQGEADGDGATERL